MDPGALSVPVHQMEKVAPNKSAKNSGHYRALYNHPPRPIWQASGCRLFYFDRAQFLLKFCRVIPYNIVFFVYLWHTTFNTSHARGNMAYRNPQRYVSFADLAVEMIADKNLALAVLKQLNHIITRTL